MLTTESKTHYCRFPMATTCNNGIYFIIFFFYIIIIILLIINGYIEDNLFDFIEKNIYKYFINYLLI